MPCFLLFGTKGCHLCEEAEQLLVEAAIAFEYRDIVDHEDWQEKYAWLIPVLWHIDGGRQLNWPFDSLQLQEFIGLCEFSGE